MDAAKSKNTIIAGVFSKNQGSEALRDIKKSIKNHSKSIKKVIDDKMDVGMDLGWLLDRFLIDFGIILGAKLAPSWHLNPKNEGTKRRSKNEW